MTGNALELIFLIMKSVYKILAFFAFVSMLCACFDDASSAGPNGESETTLSSETILSSETTVLSSSSNELESSDESVSSSSQDNAKSCSSTVNSSSSIFNPFDHVDPEDTLKELPGKLNFFDSNYTMTGYISLEGGKQEVWFLSSRQDPSGDTYREKLAKNLVDTLGARGFVFEGAVANDSVSTKYDKTSYVYALSEDNLMYKVAITRVDDGGAFLCYWSIDVKIIVLKDGSESD